MSEIKRVEAGWLEKSFEQSRIALMTNFTPMQVIQSGGKVSLPPSKEDMEKLYQKLDSHFHAWTGMGFETYRRSK